MTPQQQQQHQQSKLTYLVEAEAAELGRDLVDALTASVSSDALMQCLSPERRQMFRYMLS